MMRQVLHFQHEMRRPALLPEHGLSRHVSTAGFQLRCCDIKHHRRETFLSHSRDKTRGQVRRDSFHRLHR